MKRVLFSLLALTLAFVFACQPAQNGNGNANTNKDSNTNQSVDMMAAISNKIVQIFIYDDATPGYYKIEEPAPVTLYKTKFHKIAWCVVYEGKTPPNEVVIRNFKSPTDSNPFGSGSDIENKFSIPYADFKLCNHVTKLPKATALGNYKYLITATIGGADRGHLDPVVIIDN